MDNQISFPYNYEAYVNKGMLAWQSGNATLAAEYFQKALSIRYSEDMLVFYLMVVPETGMAQEAIEFLQEITPKLWQSRSLRDADRLFIEVLLQSGQLEEAERQIEKRKHVPGDVQEELLLLLEDKLQQLQDRRFEEKRQLHHHLLEEKEQIYKGGFLAMNAFLMHCKELPDAEFASLCIPFLEDERIHSLHKTEILEDLLKRHIQDDCTVTKGSFRRRIHTASLLPVGEAPFFQAGLRLLQDSGEWDEDIRMGLEQNLFLHAAYYYPFEEEALISAEAWLEAVRTMQQDNKQEQTASTPVSGRIHEVERAMNELANL